MGMDNDHERTGLIMVNPVKVTKYAGLQREAGIYLWDEGRVIRA